MLNRSALEVWRNQLRVARHLQDVRSVAIEEDCRHSEKRRILASCTNGFKEQMAEKETKIECRIAVVSGLKVDQRYDWLACHVGGAVRGAIGRRAISQRRRAIERGEQPRWQRGKEGAS